MAHNRSVPVDTVLPHLVYDDPGAAAKWLANAFGFEERYRYGEAPDGVQMSFGSVCLMLSRSREGRGGPKRLGSWTQMLTIFVEDVDAHYARAKAAGAEISEEPHETVYGEYQYGAIDPEGHRWLFSRHARDVAPQDWGAKTWGAIPPSAAKPGPA